MAFREIGLEQYPFIAIGVFTILAAGAVPWWDQRRVTQAVANGEAKQVEGPIRDWRVTRGHRKRQSTGVYLYNHYEHFSVGGKIGRASWRERVGQYVSNSVAAGSLKKKKQKTIHYNT